MNRFLVLSVENDADKRVHTGYSLPRVDIKDYNVKIDGKNFFDQSINDDTKTYEKIRKNNTGQGGDYINGCLLDYPYFKENYKMMDIDLSKQQALDADPTTIQQVSFAGNLDQAADTLMFFILEEEKETILDFSQGI